VISDNSDNSSYGSIQTDNTDEEEPNHLALSVKAHAEELRKKEELKKQEKLKEEARTGIRNRKRQFSKKNRKSTNIQNTMTTI
jgi:hypothetical protein